jgi:hypothetical protein
LASASADTPVGLVQHHQVGEPQVVGQLGVALAGRLELGGVHDLREPAVADVGVLAGDHQPDQVARLGDAAGFDDDDVDPRLGRGKPPQHGVQSARVDRAAQAAVAERDHRVDLPGEGERVDVHAAEVVDHDADPGALAVGEQVVEQRRLARAEEPGDEDHGDLAHETTLTPHAGAPIHGGAPPEQAVRRIPSNRRKRSAGKGSHHFHRLQ